MTAKVCPRCGNQYEDLKSTTCPECFAKLLVVDEATAEELRAARDEVVQTPEFQAAKAADDERFREQSFGACLGVIVIALVTTVVIAVVIGLAAHRRHHAAQAPPLAGRSQPAAVPGSPDILTPLPVAAATPDDVLPLTVGPFRRVRSDQAITLAGTQTPLFHAAYSFRGGTLQVYAVPTSLRTSLQNQFRQGVELAAQIGSAPTESFATEHWRFAAIGPAATGGAGADLEAFRRALGTVFRQSGPS